MATMGAREFREKLSRIANAAGIADFHRRTAAL
jgi:hypothetical protein